MGKKDKFIENINKMVNDSSHGYDQLKRWGPDYDCSSFIIQCAHDAGYNIPTGTGNTETMVSSFKNIGWKILEFDGNIYDLEPGDIILRTNHGGDMGHTEVCVAFKKWAGAHINEKGGVTGGKTGDQTGKEIGYCDPYHIGAYPYDWDYVICPPIDGENTVSPDSVKNKLNKIKCELDDVIKMV